MKKKQCTEDKSKKGKIKTIAENRKKKKGGKQ